MTGCPETRLSSGMRIWRVSKVMQRDCVGGLRDLRSRSRRTTVAITVIGGLQACLLIQRGYVAH